MKKGIVLAAVVLVLVNTTSFGETAPILPPKPIGPPHSCSGRNHERDLVEAGPSLLIVVGLRIGVDGRVKDIAITTSSGSDKVDDMVKSCVQNFLYNPATQNGLPVEVPWKATIVITLR